MITYRSTPTEPPRHRVGFLHRLRHWLWLAPRRLIEVRYPNGANLHTKPSLLVECAICGEQKWIPRYPHRIGGRCSS